jgi:hypothetical protein
MQKFALSAVSEIGKEQQHSELSEELKIFIH